MAGAEGTRWRRRRSDRGTVPPGGSRWPWWQPYRRPNSPHPCPAPRPRRQREAAAADPKPAAQPDTRENPSQTAASQEANRRLGGDQVPLGRSRGHRALCPVALSRSLAPGTRPEASALLSEASGLGPGLRLPGWRAAAAPRPNSLSGGNTSWYGRSGLAPSETFTWRSTSPMAR